MFHFYLNTKHPSKQSPHKPLASALSLAGPNKLEMSRQAPCEDINYGHDLQKTSNNINNIVFCCE